MIIFYENDRQICSLNTLFYNMIYIKIEDIMMKYLWLLYIIMSNSLILNHVMLNNLFF